MCCTYLTCVVFTLGGETLKSDEAYRFWRGKNQCASWVVFHALCLRDGRALLSDIEAVLPSDGEQKTLHDVYLALRGLGFKAEPLLLPRDLRSIGRKALILPVALGPNGIRHFVVGVTTNEGKVWVLDGPNPAEAVSAEWLSPLHLGIALDLTPDSAATSPSWNWLIAIAGLATLLALVCAYPLARKSRLFVLRTTHETRS